MWPLPPFKSRFCYWSSSLHHNFGVGFCPVHIIAYLHSWNFLVEICNQFLFCFLEKSRTVGSFVSWLSRLRRTFWIVYLFFFITYVLVQYNCSRVEALYISLYRIRDAESRPICIFVSIWLVQFYAIEISGANQLALLHESCSNSWEPTMINSSLLVGISCLWISLHTYSQ